MAPEPIATFSIVACDLDAGQWGVAVQSKFLAVGSLVPWAEPHVGAIATQSYANPRYGPDGLELLRGGRSAQETIEALTAADDGRAHRQVGIVDAEGHAATFTGDEDVDRLLRRVPLAQEREALRPVTGVRVRLRGDRADLRLRPRHDRSHREELRCHRYAPLSRMQVTGGDRERRDRGNRQGRATGHRSARAGRARGDRAARAVREPPTPPAAQAPL